MDAVMAKAEADINEMLEAGQAEEALAAGRELRRACQEAADKVAEARALMLTCNALWELWRVDECIAAANEAEAMFAAEVQTQRQAEALVYIAEASYALDKCHPALHAARRAVRLFRRMGDDEKEVRARLLVCQALTATLAGRMPSAWSEAVDEAQAAVDAASRSGERELVASAHLQAAQAKSGAGEALAALADAGMAGNIYRELGWKPEEVAAQLVSARVYVESRNFEAALAIAQTARELARDCEEGEELVNQATHLIHAARQKKRPDEVPWTPTAADDADDGDAAQEELPKERTTADRQARVEQAAKESVRSAAKKAYKQALTFYLEHESATQVPLMEAWVTPFDSAKYFSKPWHLLQEVKDGGG